MGRLPKFSTLEEEAEFWEHHSLTEYVDELEDVEFEVEVSPEDTMLTFRASPQLIRRLQEIARARGSSLQELLREWAETVGHRGG